MQRKFYGWCVGLILLVGLNRVVAASVSLSWQPGTATNAIAGYNIYYGTVSGNYTNKIYVGNVTNATIANLKCGDTYFFSATTVDAGGQESSFSNETQFIVPGILTLSAGSTPGSPMQINFPVAPNHWYEVQATADFQTWTTIWQTDVATTNAWVQFSDPQVGLFSSRFYRLVLH